MTNLIVYHNVGNFRDSWHNSSTWRYSCIDARDFGEGNLPLRWGFHRFGGRRFPVVARDRPVAMRVSTCPDDRRHGSGCTTADRTSPPASSTWVASKLPPVGSVILLR